MSKDCNSQDYIPPLSSRILPLLLAIGVPASYIAVFPSSSSSMGAGGALWILAVGVKYYIGRIVYSKKSRIVDASIGGVWSAFTELGSVALWFHYQISSSPIPSEAVVAVGIGAGCTEIIGLYIYGIVHHIKTPAKPPSEWVKGARVSWVIRYMFLIERLCALSIHVGSRCLIYMAVRSGSVVLSVIPILLFSIIDGSAIYGKSTGWNWYQPRLATRFYFFIMICGIVQIILYFWLMVSSYAN